MHPGSSHQGDPRARALPEYPGYHRRGVSTARSVGHRDRHDRCVQRGHAAGHRQYRARGAGPPRGEVRAAGGANADDGREVMRECLQEAATKVIHELERDLRTLGTIAAVSPLLGLLGTVIGMIDVFNAVMLQGTGNTAVLAGGSSKALSTTAAGLTVAIRALCCHRVQVRRVE